MINCPYCGKLTDPKLDNCPHCGGYVQKQAPSGPKSTRGSNQTCPSCHALVQDGDIICVACGTNLLTGQKITEEKEAKAPGRFSSSFIIVGLVAVGAIVAIIFLVGYLMRDPMRHITDLAKEGNYLQASKELTAYVQHYPDNAAAHFLLGKIQWQMDDFSAAGESFEKAYDAQPKNFQAGMMAVMSMALSRNGAATRNRQTAILKQLNDSFPGNEDVQRLLALELGGGDNIKEQITILKELLDQNPQDETAQAAMGIALALDGDYAGAFQELESIETKNGNHTAAMAFVTDLMGNQEESLRLLDSAVEGGTSVQADALVRSAAILISEGKFTEAEMRLNNALELDKANVTAQFYRAVCLYCRGATSEALQNFDLVAQQTSPHTPDALAAAASIYLLQNDATKAREVLGRAIESGGNDAAAYTLHGRALAMTGENDKARESFAAALAADSSYAPAHLESGLLFIKQQFFSEGLKELEQYLSLLDEDAPGGRRAEIEMLVYQLKQASGKAAPSEKGNA